MGPVIYEIHARGFTKSPSSGVKEPGTFAGLIEKIPYLKELGVTAVELLPVFDFDESSALGRGWARASQFLGIRPDRLFRAPFVGLRSPESGSHLDEFRDMVKALHKAGIEVILDVVFNHTGEGNTRGRLLFQGDR